jgi:Tol biopolymer transport system component
LKKSVIATAVAGIAVLSAVIAPGASASFAGRNGKILFQATTSGSDYDTRTLDPVTGATASIDASGSPTKTRVNVANDRQAQWSPDGTRLAFVSNRDRGNDEVYVKNTATGSLSRLTSTSGSEMSPTWSPDGRQIAYTLGTYANGAWGYDLWLMNSDGTARHQLTNSSLHDIQPAFSPDGTKLSFHRGKGEGPDYDIMVMTLATGVVTQLNLDNDINDMSADWSPDGTKIVFTRGWPNATLYVMPATGETADTPAVPLTSALNAAGWPKTYIADWSPDGTQIAFDACSDASAGGTNTCEIWTIGADGTGARRLTNNSYFDGGADWRTI